MQSNKIKNKSSIDTALKALTKSYGKAYDTRGIVDSVYRAIPTGYDDLDDILTNGARGIYLGGIIELFGSEGAGKTSVAMRIVSQAQSLGYNCLWVDAESGFAPDLAEINGINLKKLIMPDLSEMSSKTSGVGGLMDAAHVLDMTYKSIMTNAFALIVVDSVAGLMPERVLKADYDPNSPGVSGVARAMSEELKKIAAACKKTETSIIFINQKRDQIGKYYQDPFHTPGGKALKFFASQRICIERVGGKSSSVIIQNDNGEEEIIGHYAKVYIPKNKRSVPVPKTHQLEIPIYYRKYNPDDALKCYQLARKLKVITIRKGILTWKKNDKIELQLDGESAVLHKIREDKLEPKLAYECVSAADSDKNKSKNNPVIIPSYIRKLSNNYVLEK